MAGRDNLQKSGEAGVFYREHPTRKHGVRADRQWIVRQTLAGKTRLSTLGWWSSGVTLGDAINKAAEYRENHAWNEAHPDQQPKPICKQDEDEAAERKRQEIERRKAAEARANITILQLWDEVYFPLAQQTKKPATVISERTLFDKWLKRDFGNRRLVDLTKLDFARIAKKLGKEGRSPRTVHYVVSVLLQIWSVAFDNGLVAVQPPRRKTLNLPAIDNERTRAFTPEEAQRFLAALQHRSPQWHDICLLSLLTGLRASEVFKLRKADIDLDRGLLFLRSPKKAKSQHLQIGDSARQHLAEMLQRSPSDTILLVCARDNKPVRYVSDTVQRTIEALGLNDGADEKARLTFHSLRHTAATWALEQGQDIYHVSKMLRHTTVRMTEQRYAHLSNETVKRTADSIGDVLKGKTTSKATEPVTGRK
ncbi:MAG: site-specific integrase [Desulfuromonas thiophila]|nr:site-specific integrase [Desulfuromonas thiophila]